MFNQFLLLAERNPFRDMASVVRDRREHFDPLDLLPWLFVLAALFGSLAIVSRYLNRQDKRRLYNNPRALFIALCRAHELGRMDCRLLRQLAKANDVEQPALLFLDPELFEAALSAPEFRRHQTAIEALIAKLFVNEPPLIKVALASPRHKKHNRSQPAAQIVATPRRPPPRRRRSHLAGSGRERSRHEPPTRARWVRSRPKEVPVLPSSMPCERSRR